MRAAIGRTTTAVIGRSAGASQRFAAASLRFPRRAPTGETASIEPFRRGVATPATN